MFTLACKDIGTPECSYVAREETAEKTVDNMLKHARETHPDKLSALSKNMNEKEILDMIASKVQQSL